MLAHEHGGNFGGDAAKHLAFGIHVMPGLLDGSGFGD
jgi:hypothetical protein